MWKWEYNVVKGNFTCRSPSVSTSIRHNVGLIFQGAQSHRPSRPPTIPIPPVGPLDRPLTGLALKLGLRRLKDLKMAHFFSKILRHNVGRFCKHTENRVDVYTGMKASKCLIIASYRNSQNLPCEPNRITLHDLFSEGNRILRRQKLDAHRRWSAKRRYHIGRRDRFFLYRADI